MSKLRYGIAAASVLAPALVGVASVSAYSSSPTTVDGLVVDNEAKTINLTKDVSACLDFTSGDNYTLNLGNFSLTAKDDSCTPIMLNGGTLTITGDKSGQITNTSSSVSALVNNVAGNLTINSGNFVQNGLNSAILASGSGSTKIYGGYFRNADTDNDAGVVATTGEAGATVTISGGTFIADEYEYVIVDDALSSTKLNNFSITGGDFVGVVYFTGEAFISGGTFDTDPDEADFYNFTNIVEKSAVADGYESVYDGTEGVYIVRKRQEPLATIALNKSEITLNIGAEELIGITYGPTTFNTNNLSSVFGVIVDDDDNSIATCYTTTDYDAMKPDYSSLTCYGFRAGSGTMTITATDRSGNEAKATLKVTVTNKFEGGSADDHDEEGNWYGASVSLDTAVEDAKEVVVSLEKIPEKLGDVDELKLMFDVSLKDANGNIVSVTDNGVTVVLSFGDELLGGIYKYFQIVYVDENGNVKEYFDVPEENIQRTEFKDFNGNTHVWYVITFTTTHLSNYGVLASNTEFPSAEILNKLIAPDTGTRTRETEGASATNMIMTVVCAITIALYARGIALAKRNK